MDKQQGPLATALLIASLGLGVGSVPLALAQDEVPAGMPNMAEMMKQMPPEQAELLRKMMSGQYDGNTDAMMQEMGEADATAQRRRDQAHAEEKARREAATPARGERPPAPDSGWVKGFVSRYISALKGSNSLAQTQRFRAPGRQSHRETASVLNNAPGVARQQLDIIHRALSRCSNVQVQLDAGDRTAAKNGEHAYRVLNHGAEGNYCFTMTLAPNTAGSGEAWLIGFEQWGG